MLLLLLLLLSVEGFSFSEDIWCNRNENNELFCGSEVSSDVGLAKIVFKVPGKNATVETKFKQRIAEFDGIASGGLKILQGFNVVRIEVLLKKIERGSLDDLGNNVTELWLMTRNIGSCSFIGVHERLKTLRLDAKFGDLQLQKDAFSGLEDLEMLLLLRYGHMASYPIGDSSGTQCVYALCALRNLRYLKVSVSLPCINVELQGIPPTALITPLKYSEWDLYQYTEAICPIKIFTCHYNNQLKCGNLNPACSTPIIDPIVRGAKTSTIILIAILVVLVVIGVVASIAYGISQTAAAKGPVPTAVPT